MLPNKTVRRMSYFPLLLLIIAIIIQPGRSKELMTISDGGPNQAYCSSSGSHHPSFDEISGYHLKACCLEIPRLLNIQRNASGNIISLSGMNSDMLSWLSSAYNFTYECLTLPPPLRSSFENTSTSVGFYHMLKFQMCDVIVGPVTIMYSRFLHFDFLNPYMDGPAMMLIPKPEISVSHLDAIWKPFQTTVWLVLLILLVVVTLALALLDYFSSELDKDFPPRTLSYLITDYGLFVFQTIALQGGYPLYNNKLKIRFAMGTWCLFCFVIVTSYSSVLTSFIMAPRYQPLISSVHELAKSKEASPVVISGMATDILITNSDDQIMKELRHKIEADPKNHRCHNASMCYELVKSGPNVFIDSRGQLVLAMAKDYEKTGKCNSALVKGEFVAVYLSAWGVRWGDPRKEVLNRGILRMQASGLIVWWDRRTAGSERCVIEGQHPLRSPLTRLTMSNLQGPFAILVGGFVLAMFSWIVEMIITYCH